MAVSAKSPYAHTPTGAGNVVLPYPNHYRPSIPGGPEAVLAYLDELLATICPPEQTAALIYEPILSDGGMTTPPAGFLAALAERCRRHGIALVADEAKVGIGRSGQMLASLGRREPRRRDSRQGPRRRLADLGGDRPRRGDGLPRALRDADDAREPRQRGGGPRGAACDRPGGWSPTRARSATAAAGLRELAERHPSIGDVRGHGLAIGVDLVTDRESREPDAELAARVVASALEHGAIMFRIGVHENVLQLTPSLTFSRADAQRALTILARALADATEGA